MSFEGTTIAELQQMIDAPATAVGTVILLGSHIFKGDGIKATLAISKPIVLVGSGQNRTVLDCQVVIAAASAAVASLHFVVLYGLSVCNGLEVKDNDYNFVKLVDLLISLPDAIQKFENKIPTQNDCVTIGSSKVLVQSCRVYGGSDGLSYLGSGDLHILRSEIRYACCRGIFANTSFVIEDSVVQDVGSYGMKTRGGVTRRGRNDIASGPWDSVNPYF